jgi:hypothetical protein
MSDVEQVVETSAQQVHITEPANPEATVDAASLGVDQASFDKYYKDGNFDWANYGKEQAFKASQASEAPTEAKAEEVQPEAAAAVADAGLDWNSLGAKVSEQGNIDESDYAALTAIGIPEGVISDYIRAVQVSAQSIIDSVIDDFGGQDSFDAVYAALHVNTTEEQRNKLDGLLRDEDTRAAGIAQALKMAGMDAPTQPNAQPAPQPVASQGNAANAPGSVVGFTTQEEQIQAQRDPRYATDPAYREQVIQRIAASTYNMNTRMAGAGL